MLRWLGGGLNERRMVYQVSILDNRLRYLVKLLQIFVSSLLLRSHATETDATMLSSTSTICVLVEEMRMNILR